jgi:hypothetical protein
MHQHAAYIANIAAKASECTGILFRGNDSRLPGTGVWEKRVA